MGAGQSARKLTINNEEDIDVIKVSNAVVQQLTRKANETASEPINKQQKEQELYNQDQYWQERLENLEKNHLKINSIMDQEYKRAAEELYTSDQKNVNIQDAVQPCLESSTKVLKCYQEHPKEILMCSNLVQEFSDCVDQRRACVIAARC
ncbi:MICOS complex subunit mic25 isoform X2 [Colletes gigas]|uniref:MICOS complex subunit mic25 isoform X2 n=1 Tax=Colletes gigas TaxID=935657 RepID=UPI001C9AAC72|nr:MICOS complex subunit mic25 isoform X2 [Colletes gigas]